MHRVLTRIDGRADRGFSMLLVIMAMFVMSMFVAAAFAAANSDFRLSGSSVERKNAIAGADAGLNFYSNRLQMDPDYWIKCDTGELPNSSEPNPVNQLWNGTGKDPRRWRTVPGSTDQYTIELIPAKGYTSCDPVKQQSFVDQDTGTFKIKITARASAGATRTRSIIVTFKRDSFLNYVYFTDYENRDPAAESDSTERAKQVKNCADKYRTARAGKGCAEIQFASGDAINGPLHTNDENLYICGTPTFGRTVNQDGSTRPSLTDFTEVSGGGTGHVANPGNSACADNPKVNYPGGKFVTKAPRLRLPTSNKTLAAVATNSQSLYTGVTWIRLRGNVMDITNKGTTVTKNWPNSGVVYVQNGNSCDPEFPTAADYNEPSGCGNVYVSGTYSAPLTIAAANDVIVKPTAPTTNPGDANIRQVGSSDATLGLIANNFVRVAHRVSSDCRSNSSLEPVLNNVTIEAAILALQHSFIVDNYACGTPLTKLTVTGAIVQKYRGPVGTGSASSISTGYAKNYWYDDRFRFRSPPYFLVPDDSAWKAVRTHEVLTG